MPQRRRPWPGRLQSGAWLRVCLRAQWTESDSHVGIRIAHSTSRVPVLVSHLLLTVIAVALLAAVA